MARLKNIRFHNGMAEADDYPEEDIVKGHLIVDLESEEIQSFEMAGDFGDSYLGHARARLAEMYNFINEGSRIISTAAYNKTILFLAPVRKTDLCGKIHRW